jgi:hypothetical protein
MENGGVRIFFHNTGSCNGYKSVDFQIDEEKGNLGLFTPDQSPNTQVKNEESTHI